MSSKLSKQVEAISAKLDDKPRFHLSSEMLPEIKKWKVGKTYELTMEVKQVGVRSSEDELVGDFEIVEVGEAEAE